jgi:O-antigen/teichoic acid export membrane protein
MVAKLYHVVLGLYRQDFFKSLSSLLLGTIVAQAILFLASLVLTRLYSDDDFGYYNIIISVVSIGSVISTLSYDKSIIVSRSNRRYMSAILLCAFLATSIAFIIAIGGLLCMTFKLGLPIAVRHHDVIITIPLLILANAFTQILTYSQLRNKQANIVAALKITSASSISIFQMTGSFLKSGLGLVYGHIAGTFIYFIFMTKALRNIFQHRLLVRKSLLSTARHHKNFPHYLFPNEIIDNLSNQLPLLLIGYFTSLATLGQYGLANRVLSAPAALVGQAVSQAFFQKISHETSGPFSLLQTIKQVWLGMTIIGIIPFSILFFLGPQLFALFFGEAWREAGAIASASALLLFFRFISSPTSTIYIKMNMQRQGFYFCIFALLYRLFSYLLLSVKFSLLFCIIIHTVIEVTFIILYNLYAVYKLSRLSQAAI